jgi:hypothetical protein
MRYIRAAWHVLEVVVRLSLRILEAKERAKSLQIVPTTLDLKQRAVRCDFCGPWQQNEPHTRECL